MTDDLDPDTIARTALALVPIPEHRRAPETDALAGALRTAADTSRRYGLPSEEIDGELRTMAALSRRVLTMAYAQGI